MPEGSDADNYEGMMMHNFKTIVTALGGNAAIPVALGEASPTKERKE